MSLPELTPIEEHIALLVAAGRPVDVIAAELGVRSRTVEWHLVRARRKLERTTTLHERIETARRAAQGGVQ